jgi:hypothetical protein
MPTEKKPRSCFVVAPIGEPGSETRRMSDQLFDHIIKPVAEELGYSPVRADQMTEPGLITPQVMKAVMESDLVVADLSGPNASVFYELSLRHAIGKPVVHLIREDERIPFDVRDFRTIQYSTQSWDSLESTKRQLRDHIQATEKPGYVLVSPISTAVTLDALARQAPQAEKGYAPILERILGDLASLRSSVLRLESRAGSEPSPRQGNVIQEGQAEAEAMDRLSMLLPRREFNVVRLLYGLHGARPRTIEEVAGQLGQSPAQIAAIRQSALARLRGDATLERLLIDASFSAPEPFGSDLRRLVNHIPTGESTSE